MQGDRIKTIRTLAVSAGGALVDNFEYDLAHTPCATALAQTFACFSRDLQATFPQFQRLADLGAESYCAVPIRTKDGEVRGLLVVMDTKPLENSDYLRSLLGVIALSIAAEFERRRAEQERNQALADLHNVIETIPDVVFALNTQGNLVKWNRRLEDVTGYSHGELLNMPALAFVPPEEQTHTATAIQRAFTEGYAELEGNLLTKDHRLIPYHWSGALLKNPHGEPVGITGIGRDVSDRKSAEEALCRSEERLALAVEGSNDILWDAHRLPGEPWYAPQTPIWWSPRVREWLGLEESESFETLEQWAARLHPDDKDHVFGQLAAHIEQCVPYDVEYRLRTNTGDYRWIRGRGQALWDEQGEPRRMSGSCQDITERKQAEKALCESEERYRTLIDLSPNGVFVYCNGKKVYVNQAACTILGASSPEQLLDNPTFHFSHPDDYEAVHNSLAQILATGEPVRRVERKYQRLDGTSVSVEVDAGRIMWNGELAIQVIFADITQHKQAEKALRESEAFNISVLNSLSSQIVVLNSQGVIMAVNKPWLRFAEENEASHLVENFAGMNYLNVCAQAPLFAHGEEAASAQAGILAVMAGTQNEFSLEYPCHSPDQQRWFRMRVTPLLDSQAGVVVAHENITERKRTGEALRKSEERYARATVAGKVGVWELDVATGTYHGDPNLKALFGYAADELSTDPYVWLNLVHSDDQSIAVDHWQRIVNREMDREMDDSNYELRMLKKDGTVIWTEIRGRAVCDHEGQVIQFFGTTMDITERKQVQDALAQSERQLRIVLDALPVGVWFTDRAGKPLLANPAAKQIWSNIKQIGLQTENPQAGWWETIGPVNEPHRWALSHVLTTGVPSLNETFDFECLDGTKKTIRNSTVPVNDEGGVVLGAIVLNEDITLLRQAQAALQLTQFSVDHAVEGFLWIGPDARIFHVNDSICRMLEYTWEELTAMTLYDIDPNLSSEVWPAHWGELKEKGSLTFESKYWSRTGHVLDLEVTVNYLKYEGKEYNCAIMRDIGERKRAEAALRASEERYRSLYDETPTMYFTLAVDGTVRSVNRYGAEQLGYQAEELIGHSVLGLYYEADKEAVAARLSECLATPETTRYWEFRKLRKDGSLIWVREAARVGRSDTEETVVLVTCEDITERKQAEKELQKSYIFLRQVIDLDPNFIFAKDREGRFTLANKAVADAYGTTAENLLGKTDADFNPNQEEVAFFRQDDLAVIDTLQELFLPEEVITGSDGRTRWLQTVKRPILNDEGCAIMVLGWSTDITERKRMEETLRQRERALRAAIEERERISQDLHDGILQSLFAVGLALESAKSMMPPKSRKMAGPRLNQAIDQLNDVMREIRNFIAGMGSELLQGKDLPASLKQMLASLTEHQPTRVRLAVEGRAVKALSTEQSMHLIRVIQEAVSNCIKHGHAQEARVSLKMLKRGVRLSVRDNGRGFDQGATKKTGHGLTNMAARARKIGGKFTILSKVNEGTSIVLDFPKEAADVSR